MGLDAPRMIGHSVRDQQDRALYLTADVNRAPWIFNFGIGRGLTNATDPWTIKAIFSFEFE